MNSQTYRDVEQSAALAVDECAPEGMTRHLRRELAAETVRAEMAQMEAAGKVLKLTDEEIRLLRSFRRFKSRMRKNGEVFKWQTAIEEGVVISQETGLIADPNEAA